MKIVVVLFIVVSLAFQAACIAEEEFVCQDGLIYIHNDCNLCSCTTNGRMVCSLQACSIPGQKHNQRYCSKPGTTFQKDCNTCWCMKHGHTICTTEEC